MFKIMAFFILSLQVTANASTDSVSALQHVTSLYRKVLDAPESERSALSQRPELFTRSLLELRALNNRLCKVAAHEGEICGDDALGNVLLNAQEVSPNLTFKSSKFVAVLKQSQPTTVTARFSIWPGKTEDSSREITLVLQREGKLWKINDVIYLQGSSGLNSLRAQIEEANKLLVDQRRSSSEK